MKPVQIPVAVEGVPFIAAAAFAALIAAVLGYDFTALALTGATLFTLYFFRDPVRVCPVGDDLILSPADGRIITVQQEDDPVYLDGQVLKVSIFMNVFDVHVNRVPVAGRVADIRYQPGRFYSANTEKGALENEKCGMIIETGSGQRLAAVQVAGLVARRIVCWADVGDTLAAGQRFGLIRFGSRVDLYLPPSADVRVTIGERVRAGETILGKMA
ncbi:MAG: phosphatidylserine decarboxylase family protein [Thermodesulfobacteriota bacterium]